MLIFTAYYRRHSTCVLGADGVPAHPELLLHLAPRLLGLVAPHPPRLPQHLQPEEEHERRARVVRDLVTVLTVGSGCRLPSHAHLPRYEGGDHPAQQRREDGHEVEGGERAEEDDHLVVGHGEDCRDEEGLVPDLGHQDHRDGRGCG